MTQLPDGVIRVDRDLEYLPRSAQFSFRRLWVTLVLSATVLGGAALLVRTFPNSGYQAGYEAVTARDPDWVRAGVEAADGTALQLCDQLHAEIDSSAASPRYDYTSFVKGCGQAISQLAGRPVPLPIPGR